MTSAAFDRFYVSFEARFRGTRELITDRLRVYLPFVLPLKEFYPHAHSVDLGCGRGEWLQLLGDVGFSATGVDLDTGMLECCRAHHLDVIEGDALLQLQQLPNDSQAVISAFHVVEHMSFSSLRLLVTEAFRVLKPGGLLIMETPNPENLIVATNNFYLDPTHERPIPSALLSFLAEYTGFTRVKILRLQEDSNLVACEAPSLLDVFQGASPDYSVIAQKGGSQEIMDALADPFSRNSGLSLASIANRYDNAASVKLHKMETIAESGKIKVLQVEEKTSETEVRIQRAEAATEEAVAKAQHAEAAAGEAVAKAQRAEAVAGEAIAKVQRAEAAAGEAVAMAQRAEAAAGEAVAMAQRAETAAGKAEHEAHNLKNAVAQSEVRLHAIHASTSWRITSPIRKLVSALRPQIDFGKQKSHSNVDIVKQPGMKRDISMPSMDDFLFPGVRRDNWQMMPWERIALTGLLSRLRPTLSLEVGVYYGGSLTLTSQFVEQIIAIDIDPDTTSRFEVPKNAEVIIGNSNDEIPRLLKRFEREGKALEFVLIDADHSAAGVRRDIELILQYEPIKPMIILAHDSGNPECRRGMQEANWQANPYVHEVDLDFVPGQIIEHSVTGYRAEIWGGFAIAYLHPQPRQGELLIREGARSSIRAIHYCSGDLSVIPNNV